MFEIRRGAISLCISTIPNAGYRLDTLRDMEKHGLQLYHNGKRVRVSSLLKTQPDTGKKICVNAYRFEE